MLFFTLLSLFLFYWLPINDQGYLLAEAQGLYSALTIPKVSKRQETPRYSVLFPNYGMC